VNTSGIATWPASYVDVAVIGMRATTVAQKVCRLLRTNPHREIRIPSGLPTTWT
jgi:hypothetical protein